MWRNRLRDLLLTSLLCLCFASGCRLGPVNMPSFADDPAARRIDPNNGPFTIIEIRTPDPNTSRTRVERVIQWNKTQIRPNLDGASTFSAKYRSLEFRLFSRVSVPVRLGEEHRYWALVDTGYPGGLYLNDAVVRDCDLAVFPLGGHSETACPTGFCEVPAMRIGQATVTNPPCRYEQSQWQLRVLGRPLHRDRMVLIGLSFLRAFSYVRFENARREVVFSPHDAFTPDDPLQWVAVPFVLEKVQGNLRVMVDISLGSRDAHVEFDTGGARPGLLLRDDVWQDLGGAVGKKGRQATYQFGWLPCRHVIVPELRVGSLTLQRRKAAVLAQDGPLLKGIEGILSLDYFKKTDVVLDFEQDRIWIRKP